MRTYLFFIYIMANKHNNVLYVGVTNDIVRRVNEHREHLIQGFTSKYNVSKLVYYESFDFIDEAIKREKQLKEWKREWKENLIKRNNPEWKDLSEDL
ncbi:MAG: GIY-YIG nuclease family protein [Porphyromonadaceae bacterium]|nr:MAG: GIY-YIG nuclease family protein [Porphyromonadaceae bacterium]